MLCVKILISAEPCPVNSENYFSSPKYSKIDLWDFDVKSYQIETGLLNFSVHSLSFTIVEGYS